ncbi:TetR/AcrR family transcriptional regulator [Compostibacter hankyongensis]|uniref:HTH tetR-type domain-containing protein n=1 Tax=Compostibacter hankyongensis TaxID=1007089 RepID=A0ABP8FGS3_9BACT
MEKAEKSALAVTRILETAFTLFRQYGVRLVTMDEIAARMGMSKKTLYLHFADKDELVTRVVQHSVQGIQDLCLTYQQSAGDAIEELLQTMRYLEGFFRNMNPVVIMDLQKYHPKAYAVFREHMDGFVLKNIYANLKRGMTEGLYRDNIRMDIVAKARLETCMICFRPEFFPGDRYEMSQVQQELRLNFLFGLSTLKGYKLIQRYLKKQTASETAKTA